jgi:hypothetical protein
MHVNVWNKSEQSSVNKWVSNAKSYTRKNNAKFSKISEAYPNVRNMVKNTGKETIDALYRNAHEKHTKGGLRQKKTRRNRRL